MNIYVPAKGNPNARIAIVGEAPSYEEEQALEPFVGTDGRELDRLLKDSGINRYDCWITNVSKYMVVPNARNAKPKSFQSRARESNINLEQQIDELRKELYQINPNVILAFGNTALWALTGKDGIHNYRGSILPGMGKKVVSTFHPGAFRQEKVESWARQVTLFDMKRALLQSSFPDIRRPSRSLNICRNSAQLYDFIQRHKNQKPSVDIEAIHCIPVCIGLAFNRYEGLSIPLWNDLGFVTISNIPHADLVSMWILLANLLANSDCIGQNFKYDEDKISRLGFIIRKLISDTLLKAFCINPELPKNLAFNTSTYTEEPYYKDEGSEFDYTKQPIDDLFIYNARDAVVTKEIDEEQDKDLDDLDLRKFYENFLMPLHKLYLDIENVGFRISEERREILIEKYIKWDERLKYEMFKNTGFKLENTGWQKVSKLLYDELKIPGREGTGEEVLTGLLNRTKSLTQRGAIENVLERRRVEKTVNQYLMALPDFDGRMKTTYYLCLNTGRTATGLQEPPIRPRIEIRDEENHKKKKPLGMAFQTITKHGDIGNDIRSMFIPDEGEIFLQADSAQAEARVVFLLADDEEALKLIDEIDYHALTASWFVGGTMDDWSKKKLGYEHPNRFLGKTLRHAGHLGAKKRRAATEVNTQARKYKIDLIITEHQAEIALNTFHRMQPKIRNTFHAGIEKALEGKRMLTAPLPYGIDAPTGGKRIFYERWSDELFRQAYSYIPQRAITDNTKASALRIKQIFPTIKIILESHDSLLFSIKKSEVREKSRIIKQEMERPISFARCSIERRDLIIPCEIEVGDNYQELRKYKFIDPNVELQLI